MKRKIVFLIFPDFQLLDITGPIAVFETSDFLTAKNDGYKTQVVSLSGGLVKSSAGLAIDSEPLKKINSADTLVIAGGSGARDPNLDKGYVEFIRRIDKHCHRTTSVCTGSFLLARSGLINGLSATTHWRHSSELQQEFPEVNVQTDDIWTRNGKYWTSAGVTAGIDLALALVSENHGEKIAQKSAREIVVYYRRPGGQSQFSSIDDLNIQNGRFNELLAWIREHIEKPLGVDDLAEKMAMSNRNFSRQFRQIMGETPAKTIERIRLEVARDLVENSDLTIEKAATQTGFNNVERMRRSFIRSYGQSPRAMRTQRKTP